MKKGVFFLFLVTTGVMLTIVLGKAQEQRSISEGLTILNNNGPSEAKVYFREFYDNTGNEEAAYYLAWCHFRDGETERAEAINDALIALTKNNFLLGKGYYLGGLIAYRRSNFSQAQKNLKEALSYELDERDRAYIVVMIGTCLLSEKKFNEAIDHLENCGVENGYAWDIIAECHASVENYGLALRFCEKALEWYQENRLFLNFYNSLSQRGFYRFLTGDIPGGREDTLTVDEYCEENKVVNLSYYNTINWILIMRCSDLEYQPYATEVEGFIQKSGDHLLKELLDFALSWHCDVESK